MQSTIVVLLAIFLFEAICKPIAPEVDDSYELCQSNDLENCTISFRRNDVRMPLPVLDTDEETIDLSDLTSTEVELSAKNLIWDDIKINDDTKIDLYSSEAIDSESYSYSEEENIKTTRVFSNKVFKDRDYTQQTGELGAVYNEQNYISPDENSSNAENDDNISNDEDIVKNEDNTGQNYQEKLLQENVEPMDGKFTLGVEISIINEADRKYINKAVVGNYLKQSRQSKSAFPDYEDTSTSEDTDAVTDLDILHNLELLDNQGNDDIEEDIDILKQTETLLSKETDNMMYPKFSISEEAHFARDSNTTTIIGCVVGCGESIPRAGPESQVTEIRHEEIDLEIKILESDLGETTTPAIWNTGEFVDRTSRNYHLFKRDIEDEGNIDSNLINFTSIANANASNIDEIVITDLFENTTDIEDIANFLEKIVNSTSFDILANKLQENDAISLNNLSTKDSWAAGYYDDEFDSSEIYYVETIDIEEESVTPQDKRNIYSNDNNAWYLFSIGDNLLAPGYV